MEWLLGTVSYEVRGGEEAAQSADRYTLAISAVLVRKLTGIVFYSIALY